MKHLLLLVLLIACQKSWGQIPLDAYKNEINNLKTDDELELYWKKLEKIDQDILVNMIDPALADSLSIDLMIRTALLFELKGDLAHFPGNVVPLLNLSHNQVGACQVIFWPVIETCKSRGGVVETFGGGYPSYQLESVANSFYNYSLFGQQERYEELCQRLRSASSGSVVENLLKQVDQLKQVRSLRVTEVLGSWYMQPFTNLIEETTFELVRMTDNQFYLKTAGRFQRLLEIESGNTMRSFQIEQEPFGWQYRYATDGTLILRDAQGNDLIRYTKAISENK